MVKMHKPPFSTRGGDGMILTALMIIVGIAIFAVIISAIFQVIRFIFSIPFIGILAVIFILLMIFRF